MPPKLALLANNRMMFFSTVGSGITGGAWCGFNSRINHNIIASPMLIYIKTLSLAFLDVVVSDNIAEAFYFWNSLVPMRFMQNKLLPIQQFVELQMMVVV
jgi:hypothetical protein